MKLFLVTLLLVGALSFNEGTKISKLHEILEETSNLLNEIKKEVLDQDTARAADAGCVDKAPDAHCTKWKSKLCGSHQKFTENCKKTCGQCEQEASSTSVPATGTTTTKTTKTTTTTTVPPSTNDADVKECNDDNKGHCECGDLSKGFQTYVFKISDVTRCFTVYHPPERASEKLPVVLSSRCYGQDRLSGLDMVNEKQDSNKAAARYGYSRIGLSTPDGHWTFGNDNVVNDNNPMPCADSDSKDIPYLKTVFKFIESRPDQFDASKIYAEGFSQNSMFSAYIGFCFADKVLGIWQGGSGMSLTGEEPNLPGCQGQCTATAYAKYGNCNQCKATEPCTECQYWPIYPCYRKERAMIDCLAEYNNDFIAVSRNDPEEKSTSKYMYDRLVNEGHDARLLRFTPNENSPNNVAGGHKNPKNTEYWQVGCLGITPSCGSECEAAFLECVNQQVADGAANVEAFQSCIDPSNEQFPEKCTKECAPTLDMLKASETPYVVELAYDEFGSEDLATPNVSRPASSLCEA